MRKTLRSVVTMLAMLVITLPALAATTQTATLSWSAPTTRVDGTALQSSEIASYNVYYSVGSQPTTASTKARVDSGSATGTTVTLNLDPSPSPQTVYFAVTAVDTNGVESALSNVASKSFTVESTSPPKPPTSVTFSIVCGDGCKISSN